MTVQAVVFSGLPKQLTTSAAPTVLYTIPAVPTSVALAAGRLRFTNEDSATHTVTAYAIPSGGSASATTAFLNAESVAPNAHMDVDMPVLGAGGVYSAFADALTTVSAFQLGGVLVSP